MPICRGWHDERHSREGGRKPGPPSFSNEAMQQTVSPTEHEIAAVAYQLWLDSGCTHGSDCEHWFRAQAILTSTFVARREDPAASPRTHRCDPRTEPEVFNLERWEGHWEIWEREWGGARWIWDVRTSGVRVSSPA